MTWRELSAEQYYSLREPVLIDVRSPCKIECERIPGAINIPLLSNEERAKVGTAYVQNGEMPARRLALDIMAPKIPHLVDQIIVHKRQASALVVYCWRGGLRSETVASFLTVIGIDCWRLTGGYKAWRRMVLRDFENDRYSFEPIILHGRTGVGKTEILATLQKRRLTVLDLEEIARHRGSVFGGMGLGEQPSQKIFEGDLWQALKPLEAVPLFMEAESRKIGRLAVPDFLLRRIATGRRILVTGDLSIRARRLTAQYANVLSPQALGEAMQALASLKERIGKSSIAEISLLAGRGDWLSAVSILLSQYYDPLYDKGIAKYEPYELTVSGDDPLKAADLIIEWCDVRTKCGTNY